MFGMGSLTQPLVCGFCSFLSTLGVLLLTINPIAVAALFISIASNYPRQQREAMIGTGSWIAFSMMLVFAIFGESILTFLGVNFAAFHIASGALLFMLGIGILRSNDEDDSAGVEKRRRDLAITPLAVPFIAGPGALTAIAAQSEVGTCVGWIQSIAAIAAITVAAVVTYGLLMLTSKYFHVLGKTAAKLFFRLSGLIFLAMALQYILQGLERTQLLARYFGC